MARHAGFAAAVTVSELYLNQMLWIEFQKLEPISSNHLFPVPTRVSLPDGRTARLSGIALFDPRPTMSLAANPTNTIALSASAIAFVSASLEDGATVSEERTFKVRISAAVRIAADIDVAQDGLYLRWLPAGSAVDTLNVTELDGAPIPDWLIQALNSPEMRLALNLALQSAGPVRISGRLFPRNIFHVQSANFESTGISVFEWFFIDENIASAPIRVLDGCIAVGINFQNFPPGDPFQLVDLNTHWGDSVQYFWPATHASESDRPLIVPGDVSKAAGDIAVLVNADVVRAIVDKISAQITGTPIAPGVRISRVSMTPVFFDKPLRGREIALRVDFTLTHDIAGDVSGSVFLQFFAVDIDWALYSGHEAIDVPWWVDAAVATLGIALSAAFPMFSPLIAVGVIAAIDGIIPSAVGNATEAAIASRARGKQVARGVETTTFAGPQGEVTAYKGTKSIHLSSEGLGMTMTDVVPSVRFAEPTAAAEVATLTNFLDAGSPAPYAFRLALRPDLAALATDCSVQLIVSRGDTGEEVGRSEGPFATNNTLFLNHLTESLYFVDSFRVQARIFLNRVALEGLLFAADTIVTVTDTYDRRRPFVTWEQHWAHFRNPVDPTSFWHRLNHPHIHRTAASARCLVLRQRAVRLANNPFGLGVDYRDALDFDFSQVPFQRKMLCDYCFFGGPTLSEPFPREDWFSR